MTHHTKRQTDANETQERLLDTVSFNLRAGDAALVAAEYMRLPLHAKSDDFFSLPAPEVPLGDILSALQAARDEN